MDDATIIIAALAPLFLVALAIFVLVVVIEAVALWRTKWTSPVRASGASVLANIISTAFIWNFLGLDFLYFQVEVGYVDLLLSMWLAWTVSVFVESPVIWLFNRREVIRALKATVIANSASYLVLLVVASGYRLVLSYLN
jgi:hypothetical protein